MLVVYFACMGGLVQSCWVFQVDILSSSHSLGDSTYSAEQLSPGIPLCPRLYTTCPLTVCFESYTQLQLMEPVWGNMHG